MYILQGIYMKFTGDIPSARFLPVPVLIMSFERNKDIT